MLALLEEKLHSAVEAAIEDSVRVTSGPGTGGPGTNVKQLVEVSVRDLKVARPASNEEILAERERSWLAFTHTWNASGNKRNFTLPKELTGEVVEVEAPPGHSVTLGDDYFIEDRTLCFYRPPTKGKPGVKAFLRGGQATGYRESLPCRVDVNLIVWAKNINDADSLFFRSYNTLLATFVNMDAIRSPLDESGVNMRLLKPAAVPDKVERCCDKVGRSKFYRVTATIAIFGELEISVTLGAEKPEAVIEEIQYQTQPVKSAAGK